MNTSFNPEVSNFIFDFMQFYLTLMRNEFIIQSTMKKEQQQIFGKVVAIEMTPSTTVGKVIVDILGRGVERDELTKMLRVSSSMISHVIGGAMIHDEKLGILASMHGGISEKELKVRKYIEWLENEKSITFDDILDVMDPAESRKKRPQKAA